MMRYTLGHENTITIKEELSFIEKYCALQKLRFEDRINLNIHCEDNISNFKIPKLLLQPLVENSIIHGIEPLDKECTINISINEICENNIPYVIITIEDDGAGYNEKELSSRSKVGISNIKERLKLSFSESNFAIERTPVCGTRAVIKISKEDIKNENSNC